MLSDLTVECKIKRRLEVGGGGGGGGADLKKKKLKRPPRESSNITTIHPASPAGGTH